MRVAILVSGHIRRYNYDNFKKYILDVLTSNGHQYDIYISMWKEEGFRETGFDRGSVDYNKIISDFNPVSIEIQESMDDFFKNNYHDNQFNHKYSSPETCPNATSMWYKLHRCANLITQSRAYDAIIRVRSDIIYSSPLVIEDLYYSVRNNCIFMAKWHGKYEEVTKGMMDQFFFGPYELMIKLCINLYTNIKTYINTLNCICTGEGFLYYYLQTNNIPPCRTSIHYGIQRVDKIDPSTDIDDVVRNVAFFITHKTLDYYHMNACLHALSKSKDPLLFDVLYIYNSHQDELSNEAILEVCNSNLGHIFKTIRVFEYTPDTPKTLGADLEVIKQYMINNYKESDRLLVLKSDILVSSLFLNDLKQIQRKSFISTAPFICAKAKVPLSQILNYLEQPRCLSNKFTFYMEDENVSEINDRQKGKSEFDPEILYVSCQCKRDFSCHYMTVDVLPKIHITSKSWGGVSFEPCRPYWTEPPNSFTVHLYHGVISDNRSEDRVGCDYLVEGYNFPTKYTIVTALMDIKRGEWSTYYKRSFQQYLDNMAKLCLAIDAPLVVYIAEENVQFIKQHREYYPQTIIHAVKFEDYVLYPYKDRLKEIQSSKEYQNMIKEYDKDCPEYVTPEYNIAVNNKMRFMKLASTENPFKTDYFVWLDAGFGHGKFDTPDHTKWDLNDIFDLIQDQKLFIQVLSDNLKSTDPIQIFKNNQDYIAGNIYVAHKNVISKLHDRYYQNVDKMLKLNITDDDQYFMSLLAVEYPELFETINISNWNNYLNVFTNNISHPCF